jgi:hypothetical protein
MKTGYFEFLKLKWEKLADVTSFVIDDAAHQSASNAISRRVKITGCVSVREKHYETQLFEKPLLESSNQSG